jgi:23S rRNA (guanosine2251-2'-O)-methyltransferase
MAKERDNRKYFGPTGRGSLPKRQAPDKAPGPPARRERREFVQHDDRLSASDAALYSAGRRAALELLKNDDARERIEKIYVAYGVQGPQIGEILALARRNKIAIGELDRNKFRELERRAAQGTDSQGVIVLTSPRTYQELEEIIDQRGYDIASGEPALIIALDGIEDPHNMGAIIRSAEAAGAHAVLLPRRGAVITPAVYKTSAGAAEHIRIVKYQNLAETIRRLREEFGLVCYGLAGEGEQTIFQADLKRPICLVTGSEEKGLHRLTRDRCDALLSIPLTGKTASLNASVATAVATFEVVRQRQAP